MEAVPNIGTVSNKFTMGDVETEHVLKAAILNAKGDTIDKKNVYIRVVPKSYTFLKVSGDNQTGQIGKPLPDLLYVKVVDQQSNPVSNINLVWSTTHGSVNGSAITHPDGQGNAAWTLGSTEGTQTVKVEAKDKDGKLIKGSPIEFAAIAKGDLIILTTNNITSITSTSAISGGNITNDGGSPITARGVCWSITSNPTIANTKTTDGTGTGSFTSSITGLIANTTYQVRAYATNSAGTAYGNQVMFATLQNQQEWMTKNLEVTTYRNGDVIPQVTDSLQWANLTTGAWCYYNNDPSNGAIYGKLYNWYAVNDPRGLAPQGWHIPTANEWDSYTTSVKLIMI